MLLSAGATALAPKALPNISGIALGVCGNPSDFPKAAEFGYDYFEPSAAAIAAMSDSAFNLFRDQVKLSGISCRSFNILFRNQKVVGPAANLGEVRNYLDATFPRCKALGAKVIVWGSAGSRRVPDGYSRETAWEQMKTYLRVAGEIAKVNDVVIGIEFLRHQESNIINSGAEALKLLTEVNHPNVQMIVDYYHLAIEKEDPDIIRKAKDHIVHMHFANPAGRRWPHSPDEDPGYAKFFQMVKEINYQGGLSIEGNGTFEADGAASLEFFKTELT